ncbi:MAG: MATE family efflux transporter [Gammaproteobacteria bacterium]|jgi:MATE family multidrug resistance protein|nr:MATE family efflux transporter [Gammaproteobacteria bacterium]|tara:strand:+ start:1456 stop:2835 length:1380 start_codon:yes stop_codon:yes gene_type:complete
MLLDRLHLNKDTLQELLTIALPMVVSQGAFAVMIFTDRYFMSQIDPTHMAASLGGGVATFFSFCFFSGLLSYANALAAQYLGAGEIWKCPRVVTQGLIMVLLSLPFLAVITYFVTGIFEGMGHDPMQVELEKSYYLILMSGSAITLSKICISSYFAGIARTRVVMICDVIGLALNVPLSYVMVFGRLGFPEMGIVGAAISTLIATSFSLLLFVAFYLQKEHRKRFRVLESFKLDRAILKRFLRLGFPSGAELFLNVAAFNLFLLMFQSYGVVQGASAAIVFNWDILSFVPMMGLNIAVISLIGRFVGAGDMAKTNEVIAAGFLLALCYSAVLASVFILFRFPLVEVFAPPDGDFEEIRALSAFMMIGLSTYAMADAVILVSGGVLRGAGDTRWLMATSVTLHWAMLVAQYFIIRVLQYGPRASWWAFVALILSIAVVYVLRLKGGRWRDPEALMLVMAE